MQATAAWADRWNAVCTVTMAYDATCHARNTTRTLYGGGGAYTG